MVVLADLDLRPRDPGASYQPCDHLGPVADASAAAGVRALLADRRPCRVSQRRRSVELERRVSACIAFLVWVLRVVLELPQGDPPGNAPGHRPALEMQRLRDPPARQR